MSPSDLRALAEQSNAWPFEQAKAIVARLKKSPKDEVLFETGYGPSGLPHIGTFGEVARTTMVRHAFRVLTEDKIKTRLLAFSDDMDGLRKVPDNVPNKEMLEANLGKPLTKVPDPFDTHPSFGQHNNARLRAFLDQFGFDYEFASATDYYTSRRFALGVDYEMAGKDLIESVKLSGKICAALGGTPPEGFNFELFLDEKGQKISKSKGNGLTIDEWLRYASPESLSLFMFREPKAAKRLYFDVIPRNVDDYPQFLDGYERQDGKQRLANPMWHVHSDKPPKADAPVSFAMLLTLLS